MNHFIHVLLPLMLDAYFVKYLGSFYACLAHVFVTAHIDPGNILEEYKGSYLNPALVLILSR